MLAALLADAGGEVERLPPVHDDEEAHRRALRAALELDVAVTSGGVSVGPHDLVRAVEAELGVEEVFWGVAMRPGKPLSFGVRGSTLVFGLPGNPVSSLVGAELFVRPALLALQGASDPGPRWLHGRLAAAVRRNARRDELARARSTLLGDAVELRTGDGPGVAHDRARGRRGRALARAARRRRTACRVVCSVPEPRRVGTQFPPVAASTERRGCRRRCRRHTASRKGPRGGRSRASG